MATSARNADVDWDEFDPAQYLDHNYATLLEVDRQIMLRVRDFFAAAGLDPATTRAVDVGAGTNLYPALGMLPFSQQITLWEFGKRNVEWLENELKSYGDNWDAFWQVYTDHPGYASIEDPRDALGKATTVTKGSVFDLPVESFDIGTMFFVACSISSDPGEFHDALDRFMDSLTQNAPFALAFMGGSEGYPVGDKEFPAVQIYEETVRSYLSTRAYDGFCIDVVEAEHVRDGYKNMIVATGRVHKRK